MRPVLILLTIITVSDCAKILGLFPHTGRSHQMVFEPLLRTLAARGHHVTVASFFPRKEPLPNYTDISFEGIADIGLESTDLSIFEDIKWMLKIPVVGEGLLRHGIFQMLGKIALNVCAKAVDWPLLTDALKKEYDVVLIESFTSDCMLGLLDAHNVKAPVVGLLSCAVMPWTAPRFGLGDNPSYVPLTSLPYSTQMTFAERLENTFSNMFYNYWHRNEVQAKEQAMIEKQFGKITPLDELARNMSLLLVNTFYPLNGVRPLLPAIAEVGGMHLDPVKKPIPQYMEKFLNESEHGVLLFSFGSLIKTATMPKYKEEIFINVLSRLKQRVIWKFEDSGEEGTLIGNGNILRVKWIPQYELLQHKQVIAFLAHGGLLGMTEAVSAGKPMMVVPFFGDQPTNAAAAAAAGFAKVVPYAEITEKALEEGLQAVLSAEMRANARRLSKIWNDRQAPPLETAVYLVERVIRWGHAAPLHSVARDMPFYQYALLDVAATFIGIIFVTLATIWIILSRISRLFVKGGKEKMH